MDLRFTFGVEVFTPVRFTGLADFVVLTDFVDLAGVLDWETRLFTEELLAAALFATA